MCKRYIGDRGIEHHHEGCDGNNADDCPGIVFAGYRAGRRPFLVLFRALATATHVMRSGISGF